jgi:hypothetical protein
MLAKQENSYARFVQVNSPKPVSGIDYVRSIYKAFELPDDFVLWFARLFLPDFVVVEGRMFVAELFDRARFDELRRAGHSDVSAQFWINLLEITGLFDDMSCSEAIEFAERLTKSWNGKLESDYGESPDRARVIHDESKGEVFVVIGQPD